MISFIKKKYVTPPRCWKITFVKSSQLNYIKKFETYEAWQILKNVYLPKGPVQKVFLYKKLLTLKMKNIKDMVEYLNAFTAVTEKLANVGIELQEELGRYTF